MLKKDRVYVTGHKNPDSDSICSAIAYADFKNQTAGHSMLAIPVRLGDLNRETEFVLDYFACPVPELMETAHLSAAELNYDKIPAIGPETSLRRGLEIMNESSQNVLPVTDEENQVLGILTISDIAKPYKDVWDNRALGKSGASLTNIAQTLDASVVLSAQEGKAFSGKVLVLASDLATIKKEVAENDIVICGQRKDAQRLALDAKISLLVLTGSSQPDDEIIKLAKESRTALLITPYDTFKAGRLITQAISVRNLMTKENLITFSSDDLLKKIRETMSKSRYRAYPVVGPDNKLMGLLSRYHLISTKKKKMILVDHNERSQSVHGIEESEILEIIDHHRVADVFTGQPIYFRNEPVGSTATIVATIFFENGLQPSQQIAGLLAAAIISDTLFFKSPTSTESDRRILDRLAPIAQIDPEEFAMEMFRAGSSLKGKTPDEILRGDLKVFNAGDEKIAVSQVYTLDPSSLEDQREALIELMEEKAEGLGYSVYILMLTDIFNESSEMILAGEAKERAAQAFGKTLKNNSFQAPGVLSRKKQVIPLIG